MKLIKAVATFLFVSPLALLLPGCGAGEDVLYGPPRAEPCGSDQECIDANGPSWYCNRDAVIYEGGQAITWATCQDSSCPAGILYGPQPCATNEQCQQEHGADWYCDQDNVVADNCGNVVAWPVCQQNACDPAVLYGPPPCGNDQNCTDWYGAGWYCDQTNTFDDGCGNVATWPLCREGACEPITLYGPQPCSTDQNCIDEHGAGWVCDLDATLDNGCGEAVVWPACVESACEPVALYGPQPCSNDQNCVDWYGADWYCDAAYTLSDGCGSQTSWPMCRQRDP